MRGGDDSTKKGAHGCVRLPTALAVGFCIWVKTVSSSMRERYFSVTTSFEQPVAAFNDDLK